MCHKTASTTWKNGCVDNLETSSPAVKIILSPPFSVYGHLFPHKEHLAFWPQNLTVSNVPCSASFIPALIPWEARLPFNTTIPLWDYFFLASGLEVVLYLLSQKKCHCWHRGSGGTEGGSTAPSCDGWWAFSLLTVSSFWNLSDSALPSSVLKSDYSSFHITLVPLILMFPFPLSSSVDLPQIYLSIEQYFGTLVSSQEMKESQRKKMHFQDSTRKTSLFTFSFYRHPSGRGDLKDRKKILFWKCSGDCSMRSNSHMLAEEH